MPSPGPAAGSPPRRPDAEARPACGARATARSAASARGLLVAGLLLALLVPVAALRLGWSNPTAAEAEYRLLVAASADAGDPLPLQARASRTAFDAVVGRLTGGAGGAGRAGGGGGVVSAGPGVGLDPAAALEAGRSFSRWAGLLGVVVGAAWAYRVAARGRRGRGRELLLGAAAPPASAAAPEPLLAAIAAALALLGLGLCLPLVQQAAVLGPAAAATTALLLAAAAAWEAAAGPPRRHAGWLPAAVAVGAAALALCLWPRLAAAVTVLALWAAVAAAVRIRREPDPHRRFRGVTSVSLCGLLLLWVMLWLAFSVGGSGSGGGDGVSDRLGGPLLPDLAAAAATPERLAAPLRLYAERIGWLALAAPLAFAAAAWVRPAAGVLLALLAGATLGFAGLLADPVEADLLPAFAATLLAWSLAGAAVLLRLAPFAAAFFQAVAERFGTYALAPRVGAAGGRWRSRPCSPGAATEVRASTSPRRWWRTGRSGGRTVAPTGCGPRGRSPRRCGPAAWWRHRRPRRHASTWDAPTCCSRGSAWPSAGGRWRWRRWRWWWRRRPCERRGGRRRRHRQRRRHPAAGRPPDRGARRRLRGDRLRLGPSGGGVGGGHPQPVPRTSLGVDRRRSGGLGLPRRHSPVRRAGDPAAGGAGPASGAGWALRFCLERPRVGAAAAPGRATGDGRPGGPEAGGISGWGSGWGSGGVSGGGRGRRACRPSARSRSADGAGAGVAPGDGARGGRCGGRRSRPEPMSHSTARVHPSRSAASPTPVAPQPSAAARSSVGGRVEGRVEGRAGDRVGGRLGGRVGGVPLRGFAFDRLTLGGAVDAVLDALDAGRGGWMITSNLDHLRRAGRDEAFAAMLRDADLLVADGMPLVWASRLSGDPLPERVAGSTLSAALAAAAAGRGRSLFLLGGNPGVADAAASALRAEHPEISIVGTHCPPVGFEHDPAAATALREALRGSGADLVYVALGSPKQERLIAELRAEGLLPGAWWIGVGISLSFLCGDVERAPAWVQAAGLEWVHRLMQEPRRLARRYLVDGLPFAAKLLAGSALGRLRNPSATR